MHVQPKVMLLSVDTNTVWTRGGKNVRHWACLADFQDGFVQLSKQRGKVEKKGEQNRQINLRVYGSVEMLHLVVMTVRADANEN